MSTRPEPFLRSLAPADTCLNASAPHDGHVSCWQAGDAVPMPDGLSAAAFQEEDLSILEMKGLNTANVSFELYAANHPLWLVFSLIGTLYADQCVVAHPEHYTVCSLGTGWTPCRFDAAGKVWLLMLGIPDGRQVQLKQEWPQVAEGCPQPIGYRQRTVLKKLQHVQRRPYSTAIRLHDLVVQFLDIFQGDVQEALKSQAAEQVALYHRAITYIRKHYLDADIDRNRIAEALNVSVRTLNRAFEGKTNNVITTIRMVRLHKARDLVRGTDMPLEDIAFKLHYADAKHLSKKYQALFTRSPAQDRKISARRKKTPRVD